MARPTVYPESLVGHGRSVEGHQRRTAVSEGADPGFNDAQLPFLDEDADQGVEGPEGSGEPGRPELHVNVRAFVESDEADPARLDEEGVQHVPWPNDVDRKPEQMLRFLLPTDPPVLLDVAVPRGSSQLHVAVRRYKRPDERA